MRGEIAPSPTPFHGASRFRILVATLFLSLCLDYRAPTGGEAPQYIFAAVFVIAAVTTILLLRKVKYDGYARQTARIFTIPVVLLPITYFLYPFLSDSVRLDGTLALRNFAPYFILWLGYHAFYRILKVVSTEFFIRYFVACCAISTVWRMVYGLAIQGLAVDAVRYQILSPALPVLFAYAAYLVLSKRKSPIGAQLLMLLAVLPMVLSVTRSNLLTIGLAFLGIAILYFSCSSAKVLGRLFTIVAKGAVGLVLAATLIIVLFPNSTSRWGLRLTNDYGGTKVDITAEDRGAQAQAVGRALAEHPLFMLLGRSVGGAFRVDLQDIPNEAKIINLHTGRDMDLSDVMWTTLAFEGGLVFLAAFGLLLVNGLRESFRIARMELRAHPRAPGIAVFPYIAYVCLWSQTITSSEATAERLGPIMFGATFALCAHLLAQQRKVATTAPASNPVSPVPLAS